MTLSPTQGSQYIWAGSHQGHKPQESYIGSPVLISRFKRDFRLIKYTPVPFATNLPPNSVRVVKYLVPRRRQSLLSGSLYSSRKKRGARSKVGSWIGQTKTDIYGFIATHYNRLLCHYYYYIILIIVDCKLKRYTVPRRFR